MGLKIVHSNTRGKSPASPRGDMKYVVNYRESGEAKSFTVFIKFVSNHVFKQYDKIGQIAFSVKAKWDDLNSTIEELGQLNSKRPEGYREAMAQKRKRLDELKKELLEFGSDEFFRLRYELVRELLQDNGITNERFLSFEFWDRQVDSTVLIDLIANSVASKFDMARMH